jgi:hypothetical protein
VCKSVGVKSAEFTARKEGVVGRWVVAIDSKSITHQEGGRLTIQVEQLRGTGEESVVLMCQQSSITGQWTELQARGSAATT